MEIKRGDFWKAKKVLITGHEGFLGSWLSRTLMDLGADVVGVDKVLTKCHAVLKERRAHMTCVKADISRLASVCGIIKRHRPHIIFHLAAEAIVGEANRNPIRAFKSNIEGTWNILEAARGKRFIKAIILASSDKAYGRHEALPYSEATPLKGDHPYDVSKSCADLLAHTYFHTYKVPVCVTRCGNIYGGGDLHFSRIVPDTIRCAIMGRPLLIRSDGKFIRDYIYVQDVVDGYALLAEKMIEKGICGEAFNFSNEKPVSVLGLVKKVYALMGKKADYRVLDIVRYEIRRQYLLSSKARKILGWRPRYHLEKGLREAISWYKEYHEKG